MIQPTVYSSFEAISHMHEEWDQFMESLEAEIFLTYDWCQIWWKHYGQGKRLLIYVFRDEGAICGILPMYLDTVRLGFLQVTVLRMVSTVHTPVAVTVPLKPSALIEAFAFVLASKQGLWDLLHIGPVCGKYTLLSTLNKALLHLASPHFQVQMKGSDFQTYFHVHGSWEDQLASLGAKQRQEVRRRYEKLLKQGVAVDYIPVTSKAFDLFFDDFVRMHQSHWQAAGKPGHFRAWPKSVEFHREAAFKQFQNGRLRFFQVKVDGNVIGYRYAFKFGHTYYLYLYARDPRTSRKFDFTKIDYGEMVKRALTENVTCFDSMRGKYDHKLLLGGKLYPINSVYVLEGSLTTRIRVQLFRWQARLIDISYSKIWRARLAPRLGLRPGPFWNVWIRSGTLS